MDERFDTSPTGSGGLLTEEHSEKKRIALHLLIGMKKMYKQTWGKTVVKYATLSLLFTVCVFAGLLLNLKITLMYI